MERSNYDTIDILKFIGSILIFTVHLKLFNGLGDFGTIIVLLSRWGVPFFFLASSFFLFRKSSDQWTAVKKYMRRILILYIVWFIYNLPSIFYSRFYVRGASNPRTWLTFLKGALLSSTFKGSWYLVSSIFCAFAVYLLCKKFKTRSVVIISLAVEILCVMSSAYCRLLPQPLKSALLTLEFPLNIFGGLFFFSVGKWLAENRDSVLKISTAKYVSAAAVFYVLYFAEIYFVKKESFFRSSDCAFFLIPASICIFITALKIPLKIKNPQLFRRLSTVIYCAQGNVLVAVVLLANHFSINSAITKTCIGLVIMAVVAAAVILLQKSKRISWAKYLT